MNPSQRKRILALAEMLEQAAHIVRDIVDAASEDVMREAPVVVTANAMIRNRELVAKALADGSESTALELSTATGIPYDAMSRLLDFWWFVSDRKGGMNNTRLFKLSPRAREVGKRLSQVSRNGVPHA